jgi:FkbM family methyltransferase
MPDDASNERSRLQRQSWFGLKRHAKSLLSTPAANTALRSAARFVPALRNGRLPAPKDLREVTGEVLGTTFVMVRPDRCENAKQLYWGHGRLPGAAEAQALEIVVRLSRTADAFLDVGAYTGLFSIATARSNANLRVHAFEILPAAAELLAANVKRNGLDERVEIHREAIGGPDGEIVVPTGEGGSAIPSFYSTDMHFDDGVHVPMRSLDSVASLLEPTARVTMKIDVEATEDQVFANGERFIAAHRPTILCEILHGRARVDAIDELLRRHEYHRYLVREHDVRPSPSVIPDERFRDWLFTPSDPGDLRASGIVVAATD